MDLENWFYSKITGVDNIQGLWSGHLSSNYQNSKINIDEVIIKQSFKKIKIVMRTKESKSISRNIDIYRNEFDHLELLYIYSNEPSVTIRDKSQMHNGVCKIELINNELIGEYYTDRICENGANTRGTMILNKINSKGNYDLISLYDFFELF